MIKNENAPMKGRGNCVADTRNFTANHPEYQFLDELTSTEMNAMPELCEPLHLTYAEIKALGITAEEMDALLDQLTLYSEELTQPLDDLAITDEGLAALTVSANEIVALLRAMAHSPERITP